LKKKFWGGDIAPPQTLPFTGEGSPYSTSIFLLEIVQFYFVLAFHGILIYLFYYFLQCRLMTKIKGEEYIDNLFGKEECEKKLQELTTGMMVVHNYSKGLHTLNKKTEKF